MRILGALTMGVLVVGSGCEAETDRAAEREVVVCAASNAGFGVLWRAESIAAGMFAKAGVRIQWKGSDGCLPEGIRVTLSGQSNADFLPEALAYAQPYEGVHIIVFYDRMKNRIDAAKLPYVLAHVLVHEITHILQGVSRHSESGVMKAHWTSGDLSQMVFQPLPFTPTDIVLIQSGLETRQTRMALANHPQMLFAAQ